jgi:pleckstrin domain-containing family G protein 5
MLRSIVQTAQHKDEKLQIQEMLDRADEANVALNYHLSNNDLRQQLTEIMKTIENYDVIDTDEFIKIFPRNCPTVNLLNPMPYVSGLNYRRMFTRGDLKLKEGKAAPKVEVHCILFTDMLLICKSTSRRADRLRIFKPPLHIFHLSCVPFIEGNGFYIVSYDYFGTPTSFYMFYTVNQEESKRWTELIQMARSEFLRLSRDPGMQEKRSLNDK